MNEFRTYHPIVNFLYFVLVIGFSMFLMHPVCLTISLLCGFTYSVILKGEKAVKTNFAILPMMLVMATINPAFNHEGVTVLAYLPGGNPLTLESIVCGISSAAMIISVIIHFSCYNEVMTSDKFIYLFGKIIPSLSLIFSMTLRFVPKFTAQLKTVAEAQRGIGRGASRGSITERAKNGLSILSIMVTWALESSVETADSMKARGYGLPGRTAFSVFNFDKRDKIAFSCIAGLGLYVLVGTIAGKMSFGFFPSMKTAEMSFWGITCFAAYFALCMVPVIIEIREAKRWKALKSKI